MGMIKIGKSHRSRKELFQRGLKRGFLTVQEIETALPVGTLTAAERWLLYYSLHAAQVEIRDETGALVTVPRLTAEELEQLTRERAAAPRVEAHAEDEEEEGPGAGEHH